MIYSIFSNNNSQRLGAISYLIYIWREGSIRGIDREEILSEVYRAFDIEGLGDVGEDEIFALGTERRKLDLGGQKKTPWTRENTVDLLKAMICDENMKVSMSNFVSFFKDNLSAESDETFVVTSKQFLSCAKRLKAGMVIANKKKMDRFYKQLTHGALQQLKLGVWRLVKGEISMRLEIWRRSIHIVVVDREARLSEVYRALDIDGDSCVGEEEMFAIGSARRKYEQKSTPWTHAMTTHMLEAMNCDAMMDVNMSHFVAYFKDS